MHFRERIRLAAQLGSNLQGVAYVLDEPTIGLHARDNRILLDVLEKLQAKGNTLIVVEHDEDTIASADWVVDIGPGAGEHGGQIVVSLATEELVQESGVELLDLGEHSLPLILQNIHRYFMYVAVLFIIMLTKRTNSTF